MNLQKNQVNMVTFEDMNVDILAGLRIRIRYFLKDPDPSSGYGSGSGY